MFGGTSQVAIIGNHPPRMCGIATFTNDVRKALIAARPGLQADLYAMDEPSSLHSYPAQVVCQIAQNDLSDYRAAARRINASGAQIVCVQHEYGIFGGPAGAHLLQLLDLVDLPVVVTLHTVLEHPNADQRYVIEALARRAAKLIVMAEKGLLLLERVHGIAPTRVAVVPHGDHQRAAAMPGFQRDGAFLGLSRGAAYVWRLQTMIDGIAQQVAQRRIQRASRRWRRGQQQGADHQRGRASGRQCRRVCPSVSGGLVQEHRGRAAH